MDFAYRYTEEQERFRQEVAAWLDANLPRELTDPETYGRPRSDTWEQVVAIRRRLGENGWLAPTEAVEWGGAGLTQAHEVIILQEFDRRGLLWAVNDTVAPLRNALREWGNEEQKRQFLPAIANGQVLIWRSFVEPGAELDRDGPGVRATQDGDGFILNGEAVFVGQGAAPGYLWVLALTDADASPREAVAAFLVSADLEGISIRTPRSLAQVESHHVAFDQVWVPRHRLLGDATDGWALMNAALLAEPGVDLPPPALEPEVVDLIKYARETAHEGEALSKEPVRRQLLVEAYINSRMLRLFRMRDAWMRSTDQSLTYHAAQTALLEKRLALRLSKIVRDVIGIYALLDEQDSRTPAQGRLECHQRRSLARQNPDGVIETHAGIITRHLGLGQTRENTTTGPDLDAPTGV